MTYTKTLVKTVKLGRLRWLGHLTRANEISPCRKLTFSKPQGTRRAGRPSLRWLDSVEKDLRLLGIRGWKTKALDRNLWRRILEEAKTHTGLYCQQRRTILTNDGNVRSLGLKQRREIKYES
jgi:hypothetical protein